MNFKRTYVLLVLLVLSLSCRNNDTRKVVKTQENNLRDTLIKNTQGKIKTDCFYDNDNYRLYFSQLSLTTYCDSILNLKQPDSLFYSKLKENCIKRVAPNNANFALELILTQDIKVRDLQTDHWSSSIILTNNKKNEWSAKGVFKKDTMDLITNMKIQH